MGWLSRRLGRLALACWAASLSCATDAANSPLLTMVTPLPGTAGECRRPATSTLCDRISSGLAATASNPQGRWSLGWQARPDAALQIYDAFAQGQPGATGSAGVVQWKKGAIDRPCASLNPSCQPYADGDTQIQPGEVVLRPGTAGGYSVARWTPPHSGAVRIHAAFSGTSIHDGRPATVAEVRVRRGAVELAAGKINTDGNGNTYIYDHRVPMGVGDTVDFLVGGSAADPAHDGIGVDIEICAELLH
jgi:hypothetical protein